MVFRHAPIPRKGSGNQQQQAHKYYYCDVFLYFRLMVMLDVYVETESDNDAASCEFTLSRVCPHKTKGPARLKPFLYKPASNSIVHRRVED